MHGGWRKTRTGREASERALVAVDSWEEPGGQSPVNGVVKADIRAPETDLGGGDAPEEGGFKDEDLEPH